MKDDHAGPRCESAAADFFHCRSACAAALLESGTLGALGGTSTGGTRIATRGPNETVSAPLAVIVEDEHRFLGFHAEGIACRLGIPPADITVSGSREAVIAPRLALMVMCASLAIPLDSWFR